MSPLISIHITSQTEVQLFLLHSISNLSVYYSQLKCPGEGNGTPLQYSCLENPMDGGAW